MLFHLSPASLPTDYGETILPLARAKAHLRVFASDEDALIGILRDAAIEMVERYTNLRLLFASGNTDMVATCEGFAARLPVGRGPIGTIVVTGIDYVDASGATVALSAGAWRVLPDGFVAPQIGTSWPTSSGPVSISFRAGYATAAEIPAGLIAAALLFLGHLYSNREAVVETGMTGELPLGFGALTDAHRVYF